MSGLIGSILSTTNAIKANQSAIETAGKNMANVNNANYSRQRVEFGISGGISESIITQQRDAIIDSKIVRESSTTGTLEAQKKIYEQIQLIFGEQISGDVNSANTLDGSTTNDQLKSGLSTQIDEFFNSMNALSANPDSIPAKASVIAQAESMVNQFNSIANELESLDTDVVRSIEVEADEVNNLLREIATINEEIAKIEIRAPLSAHEFRDLRQQKLTELAKYIDFDSEEIDNGQLRITVNDKDTPASKVPLVDRTTVPNQIAYNEDSNELYLTGYTTQPLGNSPNTSAFGIEGGSLQGYLYARSTTDPHGDASSQAVGPLATMQQDLDTLAQEIVRQVSTIYDDATANEFFFDDDNNADAVDVSAITAKNISLYGGGGAIPALTAANLKTTDTGNAGANEIAIQIAELSQFESSNLRGNTFTGFISEVATDLGFHISNTNRQLENQELVLTQLQDQRASVSGVSIDEELANIIRFQRSFEASARVLQVMDEMLEIITNGLVR